uniref:Uncharacterized protein n=1 Tax=Rhodosorus marinus TaxID=101924 RepID=A0A7S0G6R7_9RHOD|mmetsp:Transcript_3812/g.5395  ORF Transcript_3812/g.5395 Transcript_3812/m.5395 type:complete len:105 (+) Transcript_3812:335-649(+)
MLEWYWMDVRRTQEDADLETRGDPPVGREWFQSEIVATAHGNVMDDLGRIPGPGFDLEASTAGIRGGDEEAGETGKPDGIGRWTEYLSRGSRRNREARRDRTLG